MLQQERRHLHRVQTGLPQTGLKGVLSEKEGLAEHLL